MNEGIAEGNCVSHGMIQMQSMGDIGEEIRTTVSGLQTKIADVERERDTKLQEIDFEMQKALSQAELDFRDKLDALNQEEANTKRNKSIDKMNALKEYRDYARDTSRYFQQLAAQAKVQSATSTSELSSLLEEIMGNTGGAMESGYGQLQTAGQGYQDSIGDLASSSALQQSPTDNIGYSNLAGQLQTGKKNKNKNVFDDAYSMAYQGLA